eukprot:1356042-Amorphochlora_amoeboformis.AAC.1
MTERVVTDRTMATTWLLPSEREKKETIEGRGEGKESSGGEQMRDGERERERVREKGGKRRGVGVEA